MTKFLAAVAQGIMSQVRVFGGSIGIAVGNIVFLRDARRNLEGVMSEDQILSLQGSALFTSTLDQNQQDEVRRIYANSFDSTMRICTYLAAASLAIAAFTWQRHPPELRRS